MELIGAEVGGDILRINLGAFRPYLITRPEHLDRVLYDNKENYQRQGWLWRPLSRLIGDPSGSDDLWWTKREVFQNLVSGPSIKRFSDAMARTISASVQEMAARAENGRPLDAADEMARIVYRAITKVLIGDKITNDQADRIGAALQAASAALRPRLAFPFVPNAVPFPGDRTFRRAVRVVDSLVFPIVEQAQRQGSDGEDIVSRLLQARTADGQRFDLQQLRDGLVSLFVAGTETTTIALTFLWTVLDSQPQVAETLQQEVDRVVGDGPITGAHLLELGYARKVALEMLRLYPPGWMLPRMVANDDVIGGVPIKGGSLIVMSPYLTHRLPDVWENPLEFDPGRHDPGQQRHRFAYMTFGGGPHACVGKQFFTAEVQLILAAITSRFRPQVVGSPPTRPQLGLTLRPRQRVQIRLRQTGPLAKR
ncbi:cytochrome P450 [Actinomadura xylanilytica]|uniref:cytochrome P450 n=1 Tax=Actinomadura xylanilytica TaxID=887459 RepID=UPI00255AF1F9|nr:cytochrome P450 [Actinomadura xylanilytica]MDL4776885.1 cytochrome P450 [Actinomadura xylanilytica]